MSREIQWKCQYEDALIQPPRGVLDINMESMLPEDADTFASAKKGVKAIQNQTNIRIIELLRFLYQQTDEAHPATVSDILAYLKERNISAVRKRCMLIWMY